MTTDWPESIRDRQELLLARSALSTRLSIPGDSGFVRGAIVALNWILESGPTPLGTERAATAENIATEEQIARGMIYGKPGEEGIPYGIAVGVEHALAWTLKKREDPPVSLHYAEDQ